MSKTVLLVEDNVDNRTIYRTILEYAGCTVVEAENGPAALRQARESRPDLILMDISIPVVDGGEVTRSLKAEAATAGIGGSRSLSRGPSGVARRSGPDGPHA